MPRAEVNEPFVNFMCSLGGSRKKSTNKLRDKIVKSVGNNLKYLRFKNIFSAL